MVGRRHGDDPDGHGNPGYIRGQRRVAAHPRIAERQCRRGNVGADKLPRCQRGRASNDRLVGSNVRSSALPARLRGRVHAGKLLVRLGSFSWVSDRREGAPGLVRGRSAADEPGYPARDVSARRTRHSHGRVRYGHRRGPGPWPCAGGSDEVKLIQGLDGDELRMVLLTPPDSPAMNYGFDVTPSRLIQGLITERGVSAASENSILELFPEKKKAVE